MSRLVLAGLVGVAATLGWSRADAKKASDDPLSRHAAQLQNLEGSTDRLTREYANPVALIKTHPLEKRLIDARVFYDLGNFETAAILLYDVVENPAFKSSQELEAAAMLLAKALLQVRNYRGAHDYLEQVAAGRDPKLADEARFYLIDMALTADATQDLERVLRQMGATGALSDRTRYALGKALVRTGQLERALGELNQVAPTSDVYILSRYYAGVVLTAQNRLEEALKVFSAVASTTGKRAEERLAKDLAQLASGRILMELGRTDEAVSAYQRIDRNSPSYEMALYEMAWSYIKREKYDRALQTVDVLLLVVKDEQVSVEAHVLRGRLAVSMGDYDNAVESYSRIVDRFAPIRNELDRFMREPGNIDKYFVWLLERRKGVSALQQPMSEKTIAWVESTEAMQRVTGVFDTLSEESSSVADTLEVADELDRAIGGANRVELFPDLQNGWVAAIMIENQYLALSSHILEHQYSVIRGRAQAGQRAEIDTAAVWRRKLELQFGDLPMTAGEYKTKKLRVDERYLDLQRKSFLVEQTMKELKRQLLAVEQYVNELQYSDDASKRMSDDREKDIRVAINDEKGKLEALYADLDAVRIQIKSEAQKIGAGDDVERSQSDLKQQLIAAHKREGLLYDAVAANVSDSAVRGFRDYSTYRERIWSGIERLRSVLVAIDRNVGEKTEELRRTVAAERRNLLGYRDSMGRYESGGRDIAHALGDELFNQAHERMKQVVLEADVGLIDVAWRKKSEKTEEIRQINIARAGKLNSLDKEETELEKETQEGEGEKPEGEGKEKTGTPEEGKPPAEGKPPEEGKPPAEPNKAETKPADGEP
jgi:tetratricopeptide (TPR) repeat protein